MALFDFIHGVVQYNPHVDVFHLRLNQLDQADYAPRRPHKGSSCRATPNGRRCPRAKRTTPGAVPEHARSMQWSARQLLRMPRRCTRSALDRVRGDLTPHKANPCVVQGAGISKRSAGITSLLHIMTTQISLAEKCGVIDVTTSPIQVIVCPDASPLWRTQATRRDFFLDCWGDIDAASDPRRWVTWLALHGSDNAGSLGRIDRCGGLNDQVKALQEDCNVLVKGVTHRFHGFLTGDGRLMEVSHKDVGGSKCWSCDKDDCLIPCPAIDGTIRWGAFLTGILCCRTIRDHVHGFCRVANAFVKRLVPHAWDGSKMTETTSVG